MKRRTAEERAMIERLKTMPDSEIDFSDAPEVADFSGWERGNFFRPVKKIITVRFDADIINFFKLTAKNYQTAMNAALREYMLEKQKNAIQVQIQADDEQPKKIRA